MKRSKENTMLARLSLKLKLLTLSLITSIGMVAVGGVGLYSSSQLTLSLKNVVDDSLPIIRDITLIDMIHDGIRGSVIEAHLGFLQNDKKRIEEAQSGINEYTQFAEKLFRDIETHQMKDELAQSIKNSKKQMQQYTTAAQKFANASAKRSESELLSDWNLFQEQFEILEKVLGEQGDYIESENVKDFGFKLKSAERLKLINILSTFFFTLVSLVVSFFISTRLSRNLNQIADGVGLSSFNVSQAATEVAGASQDVSVAVNQQATALQNTSSALVEISTMVSKSAERAEVVEKTTYESKKQAIHGKEIVDKLSQTMDRLKYSSQNSADELRKSNEKVNQIRQLIEAVAMKTRVINDIVFQTKLLSFNASVEAARAGEQGKGFSVVAEEVGNLASMSGHAAKEINSLLDGSIQQVNEIFDENKKRVDFMIKESSATLAEGAKVTEECQQALTGIVNASSLVTQMVSEINESSQQCAQGVTDITKALHEIDTSSELTKRAAQTCQRSSSEFVHEVTNLGLLTDALKRNVQGENSADNLSLGKQNKSELAPMKRTGKPSKIERISA